LTGPGWRRYHPPVPVTVLRPSLHELADVVEQIFFIACTEELHPRPEEYDAATCDYAADHGLSYSAMCQQMRQYGTFGEIHERAQVIALMRIYARRWRPLMPEDGVRRGRRRARLAGRTKKSASDCSSWQKTNRDKNRYTKPIHI
jgi:hypothetical protein